VQAVLAIQDESRARLGGEPPQGAIERFQALLKMHVRDRVRVGDQPRIVGEIEGGRKTAAPPPGFKVCWVRRDSRW